MKSSPRTSLALLVGLLCASSVRSQNTYTLDPLAGFGRSDGSIQPGDSIGTSPRESVGIIVTAPGGVVPNTSTSIIQPGDLDPRTTGSTNGYNMRGITWDPVSGKVILVDAHGGQAGSLGGANANQSIITNFANIYVMDPNSGQIAGVLATNGMGGGSYCQVVVGVADDGAVFVCNQTTASTTTGFKLYRWWSATDYATAPNLCYSNIIAPNSRLGQTMDVRGSGPNTQIIIGTANSVGNGTNCFLFTTADGTNFNLKPLSFTGVNTAIFNDGIAFGPGNTVFAKQVGGPLAYLWFDPNGTNGGLISSFSASSISGTDPLQNLAGITVDVSNHLLAGVEEIGGVANGGRGKAWLYHLYDPTNHAPAILSSRTYLPNYAKATATMGYLKFAATSPERLYVNVVNNGMLASKVDSVALAAPLFQLPPDFVGGQPRNTDLPASNRAAVGATAHFEAFATADVTNYQWYSNNVPISGATTYFLDLTNVQLSYSGSIYKVIAYNAAGSKESAHCTLTVVTASAFFHPSLLWQKQANTTALSDPANYITSNGGAGTPNERCIAYNALSNQLLVVRGLAPGSFANMNIFVVNPDTGATLYKLNKTGMTNSATLNLAGIGVADDGAVYATSVASDKSYKIYRWADTGSNTVPVAIFGTNSSCPYWQTGTANPGAYNPIQDLTGDQQFRFGDDLAVKGAGLNTQIIVDSQNNTTYAAILTPADNTMTNWNQTGFVLQNTAGSYGFQAYGTSIGRSVQLGPIMFNSQYNANLPTFWQKRNNNPPGAPMSVMAYEGGGGVAALQVANFSQPLFTNGAVGINFSLNLAASVAFSLPLNSNVNPPDQLSFYDLTDPSQAVLLSQQNLPVSTAGSTPRMANNNAVAQVVFGLNPATGSNYVFVIDGNNGVATYYLSGGVTPPPQFLTQPSHVRVLQGGTASLSAQVDQVATLTWYQGTNPPVNTGIQGSVLTFNNAQLTNAGDYFVIANNANGSRTSMVAHVTVSLPGDNYTLTNIWRVAAGNPSFPYLTTNNANTPYERSFGYNALSNQLIITHCPPADHNFAIYAVDATAGTSFYTLNTNGIIYAGGSEVSGSNPLDVDAVAVADDGAVYVACETPNASGGANGDVTKMLHVFRWADSGASTPATVIWEGDPSGQPTAINERWGDVMAARGSGTNTELILNSYDGIFGVVLKPTDSTMATFTNYWFYDAGGAGNIGRSIQFGNTNTVYEKRHNTPLIYSQYLTNTQSTVSLFGSDFASATLGPVFVDKTHNLAPGVDFVGSSTAPDAVALYDLSDVSTPMLIARYNFPANQQPNANFVGQILVSGWKVYALDANNGLMSLYINPPVNSMILHISQSGGSVTVTWGNSLAVLQSSSSISPASWSDLAGPGVTSYNTSATGTQVYYRLIQRR
ncbi:MAG: hypothetical protein C5B50_15130 [Verrucomicrobia bacterium]|nr:MAG: hypothetical protein C5B50_15130 [Verrucomicrobiota bacterium]